MTVKAAAIQFRSDSGEIANNLLRADELVSPAAAQGARVVLVPGLTPGGYLLTEKIWNTRNHSRTQRILAAKHARNALGR